MRNSFILLLSLLIVFENCSESSFRQADLQNVRFSISVSKQHEITIEDLIADKEFEFLPRFSVFKRQDDPFMAHRPANIADFPYNVVTWLALKGEKSGVLEEVEKDESQQGDGFDDRILGAKASDRTADLFRAGDHIELMPTRVDRLDTALVFHYNLEEKPYSFTAWLSLPQQGYPKLTYQFTPEENAFYSIGFTGAPSYDLENIKEIWQPMIWQEKRFPDQSYLTLAYRCPLPSALVYTEDHTLGVVADPSEFPFDPLPLKENSRFGVAVRNQQGKAQPMLFAPVMGGFGSEMKVQQTFQFTMQLYIDSNDMLSAYKKLATDVYGFRDYRSNAYHQLNRTLDNMLNYGMSHWSHFVDSLKGCAYSTDVPGAVKNVSALNPLEMALITDNQNIYQKRAYPIMEYLLSREKFLFSLDREQKIQNPSRKLDGPAAPVSELTALYNVSQGRSGAFITLAEKEYNGSRIRNLGDIEVGNTWQNSLALYRATNDDKFLKKAVEGAQTYLEMRVNQPATNFDDPDAALFFWTGFAPDYIGLFQLFEATGDEEFLEAAHQCALRYTQYVWFSPKIPEEDILVNRGGHAPLYWYLKSKGHQPMKAPEEIVPAWRLSAIGLTPESSGTCNGHRGIFMANHGPWLYRIGYHAKDKFLMDVGRSAVVGRYSNFPGYHINTARTTIYEKPDYPLRPFKELSVNSFHFNHIWPHMSIVMDHLVTDVYVKSNAAIDFPSDFIQGYAYLQSKFYGHKPGNFYDEQAWLWMPQNLIDLSSEEVNYLSARGLKTLLIAFTNQSRDAQRFTFKLNQKLTGYKSEHKVRILENNEKSGEESMVNGMMEIGIAAEGITVVVIEDIDVKTSFQHQVLENKSEKFSSAGFKSFDFGDGRAMILDLGQELKTAYIYLGQDDDVFNKVTLNYAIDDGQKTSLEDSQYPFEFTISMANASQLEFDMQGIKADGSRELSGNVILVP